MGQVVDVDAWGWGGQYFLTITVPTYLPTQDTQQSQYHKINIYTPHRLSAQQGRSQLHINPRAPATTIRDDGSRSCLGCFSISFPLPHPTFGYRTDLEPVSFDHSELRPPHRKCCTLVLRRDSASGRRRQQLRDPRTRGSRSPMVPESDPIAQK